MPFSARIYSLKILDRLLNWIKFVSWLLPTSSLENIWKIFRVKLRKWRVSWEAIFSHSPSSNEARPPIFIKPINFLLSYFSNLWLWETRLKQFNKKKYFRNDRYNLRYKKCAMCTSCTECATVENFSLLLIINSILFSLSCLLLRLRLPIYERKLNFPGLKFLPPFPV